MDHNENDPEFQRRLEIVIDVLVDALGIDREDVSRLSMKLHDDLGAESIDFLDIGYRLERRIGVRCDINTTKETTVRQLVDHVAFLEGARSKTTETAS